MMVYKKKLVVIQSSFHKFICIKPKKINKEQNMSESHFILERIDTIMYFYER